MNIGIFISLDLICGTHWCFCLTHAYIKTINGISNKEVQKGMACSDVLMNRCMLDVCGYRVCVCPCGKRNVVYVAGWGVECVANGMLCV